MTDQPQSRGGGIFIVLGIAIGIAIGSSQGRPAAGLLIGAAAGSAVAIAMWWRDRKQTGE